MLTPFPSIARVVRTGAIGVVAFACTLSAHALDDETRAIAIEVIDKANDYLRSQQDQDTGGWAVNPQGPDLPAITGLVVRGLLMDERIDHTDPAVAKGIDYMLSFQKDDGMIHDGILPSYNTAICLSALALVPTDEAKAAIEKAQGALVSIQWGDAGTDDRPADRIVERAHPFYGGWGYGGSSRPDMSNTQFALQGLYDSGYDTDSEAFKRALVFLQRTQMLDELPDGTDVNDMPYADGSTQGGFIYSTSPSGDEVGVGESKAGTIEESLSEGLTQSRLRAYGSVTYAGFKSYIYADLDRDDPRVQAAYDWLTNNFTVEENPGIGTDGYYYYLLTMARALDAWQHDLFVVRDTLTGTHSEIYAERTYSADGSGRMVLRMPDGRTIEVEDIEETEMLLFSGRLSDGTRVIVREGSGRDFVTVAFQDRVSWKKDLINRAQGLQEATGSFVSVDDRWMENNPVLITAYTVNALQHAIGGDGSASQHRRGTSAE